MKINGTPQERKHKQLGAKKINPPDNGGKGRSGCLPALITVALLGGGWLHMIATSVGWMS